MPFWAYSGILGVWAYHGILVAGWHHGRLSLLEAREYRYLLKRAEGRREGGDPDGHVHHQPEAVKPVVWDKIPTSASGIGINVSQGGIKTQRQPGRDRNGREANAASIFGFGSRSSH